MDEYVRFETYQCAAAVDLRIGVLLQRTDIVEVMACFVFDEVAKYQHLLKYVFSDTISPFPTCPNCCVNYLLTMNRVYCM